MEQYLKEFLTAISPALQALIITLFTVLLGQINLFVQKKYEQIKGNVASDQRYFLDFIVQRAVETVEQLYKGDSAQRKKEEAIAIAQAALKNFGLTVDADVIADAIEAAVFSRKENSPQG